MATTNRCLLLRAALIWTRSDSALAKLWLAVNGSGPHLSADSFHRANGPKGMPVYVLAARLGTGSRELPVWSAESPREAGPASSGLQPLRAARATSASHRSRARSNAFVKASNICVSFPSVQWERAVTRAARPEVSAAGSGASTRFYGESVEAVRRSACNITRGAGSRHAGHGPDSCARNEGAAWRWRW